MTATRAMKLDGPQVLIADDDPIIRKILDLLLQKLGFTPVLASNGKEVMALLNEEVLAALVDFNMPEADGMECLAFIKDKFPDTPVIMISTTAQVKQAVTAMKKGAFEYVTKPFDTEELSSLVRQAVQFGQVSRDNKLLRQAVGQSKPLGSFVGSSEIARKIRHQVDTIAGLNSTVLITGDSGVGKGLLARMIHYASPRAEGPLISISCPSLPRDLLESELFGHEKGAFTGAYQKRIGRVEMADGGTLFLDEIGDLPLNLQPKLLTFLQERSFQRVGGSKDVAADVRVIAATNADLKEKLQRKEFREDLYFRLNVLPLHVPPVCERREDIALLAEQILKQIASARRCPPLTITPKALVLMQSYPWPGNVREMENVLERASAFCASATITEGDLPPEITIAKGPLLAPAATNPAAVPQVALKELERLAVEQTLKLCNGNRAEAARRLGITEKTIYNMMARYGLH